MVITGRRLFLSGIQHVVAAVQWEARRAIVLTPREEAAPTCRAVLEGGGGRGGTERRRWMDNTAAFTKSVNISVNIHFTFIYTFI